MNNEAKQLARHLAHFIKQRAWGPANHIAYERATRLLELLDAEDAKAKLVAMLDKEAKAFALKQARYDALFNEGPA